MKAFLCLLAALLLLAGTARAAWSGIPDEVAEALPRGAEAVMDSAGDYTPGGLFSGVVGILRTAAGDAARVFRQRLRGAAAVLLAVVLCGAARGICRDEGTELAVPMAGALAVTALSAGSLEDLIGLGWSAIRDMNRFSRSLFPVLAAASAASGAAVTAAVRQAAALALMEALISLMDGLLMPLTYLYIGVLTASCALPENRLDALAAALKRIVTVLLTAALLGFTIYLSVSGILSGPADAAAVKVAKAAVSNVVPVVGGILAEAAEAVLAGAGVLKGTIGIFGTLAVLAACVRPFLNIGIQYLLYKGAAFLASAVGMPELCRLIDGLGGAFGLVLGMTGSCALLLLSALLSFVTVPAL